jgi:parallel beta-helix repeat protein
MNFLQLPIKKITLSLLLICATSLELLAQYSTPNTGVDWTLDDIATASPSTITISGNTYTLTENLTVSVDDILRINTDLTLEIAAGVQITVFGSFFVDSDAVTITAVNQAQPFQGFRFEEFSEINIQNTTIEYGGGLQVLTETFTLNNCVLQNNVSGTATGATVTMSRGIPIITNNSFLFNANPALSSGANQQVSAYIFNNYIEGNNQSNNNRPQINMGTTRVTDTLKIIGNTIIGDRTKIMAGGIAVANLVGGSIRAIIEDNIIRDNRYGLTVAGSNSYVLIKNNIIEDNDSQNNPNLGGSGINLNTGSAGMVVDVMGNQIRRNLWGVTMQGVANGNFGDDADNPGGNVFADNGNNSVVYALFNNTPNPVSAMNNCWVEGGLGTLAEAEGVISHVVDNASLGEVTFDPVNCENLSVDEPLLSSFMFYPNPAKNAIHFNNNQDFQSLTIYSLEGKQLYATVITQGENRVELTLPIGMYFVNFIGDNQTIVKKLIVE